MVTSSLQDQLQRALGDGYLLERELGGGGMSRVFRAHERAIGLTRQEPQRRFIMNQMAGLKNGLGQSSRV